MTKLLASCDLETEETAFDGVLSATLPSVAPQISNGPPLALILGP
jgi:hypothetical protein